MFLMRLRRSAKWAFIVLIFAFAFGFLFAGVGSGGGADIISQLLGMRGGNPVKSAEKEVAQSPRNASALITLAQAYDGAGRRSDAINAWKKYLTLKPKDTSALSQLGRLQQDIAILRFDRYSALQSTLSVASGPLGSDPLQALAGTDLLLGAYVGQQTTKVSNAYGSYTTAARAWEDTYKKFAAAVPKTDVLQRAQVELQLAQAASSAADYPTAIKSYETYLRLAPKSPLTPQIRKALAALRKVTGSG